MTESRWFKIKLERWLKKKLERIILFGADQNKVDV